MEIDSNKRNNNNTNDWHELRRKTKTQTSGQEGNIDDSMHLTSISNNIDITDPDTSFHT